MSRISRPASARPAQGKPTEPPWPWRRRRFRFRPRRRSTREFRNTRSPCGSCPKRPGCMPPAPNMSRRPPVGSPRQRRDRRARFRPPCPFRSFPDLLEHHGDISTGCGPERPTRPKSRGIARHCAGFRFRTSGLPRRRPSRRRLPPFGRRRFSGPRPSPPRRWRAGRRCCPACTIRRTVRRHDISSSR